MNLLLDSDGQEQWNYFVILCKKMCDSVQKFAISCNYNFKANNFYDNDGSMNCHKLISQLKCRSFYDNDGGMNCPCTQELTRCHVFLFYNFFNVLINIHLHDCVAWARKGASNFSFLKHTSTSAISNSFHLERLNGSIT